MLMLGCRHVGILVFDSYYRNVSSAFKLYITRQRGLSDAGALTTAMMRTQWKSISTLHAVLANRSWILIMPLAWRFQFFPSPFYDFIFRCSEWISASRSSLYSILSSRRKEPVAWYPERVIPTLDFRLNVLNPSNQESHLLQLWIQARGFCEASRVWTHSLLHTNFAILIKG